MRYEWLGKAAPYFAAIELSNLILNLYVGRVFFVAASHLIFILVFFYSQYSDIITFMRIHFHSPETLFISSILKLFKMVRS